MAGLWTAYLELTTSKGDFVSSHAHNQKWHSQLGLLPLKEVTIERSCSAQF